jgi:hypothetical protein
MRNLGADFSEALDADIVYPIFFFEGEFRGGTLRLWTGFGDRIWDAKTWSGVGWLVGISEVEESTNMQATSLTIGLPGNAEVVSIALRNIQRNKPMTIWMGLLAPDASNPDVPRGEPLGVEQIFSGLCDISEIDADPANPAVRIKYSSRVADLTRARVRRQTNEDQQIDYPGDRFFEYVGPLTDAVINWGL